MPDGKENCEGCRYWKKRFGEGVRDADPLKYTDEPWGNCRRFPPHHPASPEDVSEDGWEQPITFGYDWCGEYQPRCPAGSPPGPPA